MPRKGKKVVVRTQTKQVVQPTKRSRAKPRGRASVGVFTNIRQAKQSAPNAPLNVGVTIPTASMRMSDEAQTNCDQGRCPSVRVTGSDSMRIGLGAQIGAGTNGVYVAGLVNSSAAFGPYDVSTRLASLAGMYSWYAFRELELVFLPQVGPTAIQSATTMGSNNLIAVALDTETTSSLGADGPQTFQQVTEIDPAIAFPAWQGGSLRYRFNGTKLWATSTNNAPTDDPIEKDQLALCAHWLASNPVLISQLTHAIFVRYVIDLYRPQEPTVYPSVQRPRLRTVRDLRRDFDRLALQLSAAEQDEMKCNDIVCVSPDDRQRAGQGPPSSRTVKGRT